MEIQTRILSMENKNAGNGQNTKTEVGIGDDVTINGVVVGMNRTICKYKVVSEEVIVRLNCGTEIYVKEQEINTIRPKIVIPDKDERRGK